MAASNPVSPLPAARWFDHQVNGFGGIDFQAESVTRDEMEHAVAVLAQHGTSAILLTLITNEIDGHCRRLENFEKLRSVSPAIERMIAGYHIEGPWLSPKPGFRGAHPAEPMCAPSIPDFNRLQEAASGRIKLVTVAPEWPGSAECIAAMVAGGTRVSLGHTDANETEIDAAIRAGARFCTHLGNGTPVEMHRHDNIMQRLLARDELYACFIPDGIHLPPHVLRNLVRAKPRDRVLFTTDAMSGAGAGPGRYRIGRLEIEVGTDKVARQPGGKGFAGSTLAPDEGVANCARFLGWTEDECAHLWSEGGAELFGVRLSR